MRATTCLIMSLILLITACQPQADPVIDATPMTTVSDTTGPPIPTATPTLAATTDPDRATIPPRSNLPDAGEPTVTPLFTLTPTRVADPDMKLVEDVAAYLAALCQGDLDARAPFKEEQAYLYSLRQLSPDGQLMLFGIPITDETYTVTHNLWVMNIDGTNPRFLLNAGFIWSLKWVPGTHQVVFNTGDEYFSSSYNDLQWLNVDTAEHRVILPPTPPISPSQPNAGGPLFPSPDGKYIAMSTSTSVSLIGIDGSNYQRDVLVYDNVVTYSEYNVFANPVWAADSSGVWIAAPPLFEEAFIEVYFASLCCGLRQAGRFQMDREDNGEMLVMNMSIASPTGEYVLYSGGGLRLARTDGTSDVVYYPERAHTIRWLDATHFSFWVDDTYYLGEVDQPAQPQQAAYGCV